MTPSPERVRATALTLTGWPSVTGSPDEAAFAGKLARYLEEIWWARGLDEADPR